jgi:hypothetical protein
MLVRRKPAQETEDAMSRHRTTRSRTGMESNKDPK